MSRTDAGRDQFDPISGKPTYTDEQVREFVNFYSGYLDTGADYFEIDDVDEVDRYYDRSFENAIARAGINLYRRKGRGETERVDFGLTPDRYIKATGAPEYLKDILAPNKKRNETEAQSAYAVLSIAESPEQIATILSGYYGYDFSPIAQELGRFGGKRQRNAQSPEEFHSFVEPILKDQVTYLQATRGLNYQDALKTSFEADPMLQALYGKYGVAPIRQTDDGSTYLYDPFTYGEIRTYESKDRDFQKAFKIIASIAASYYLPGMLSTALGISKAAATTIVAAGQTAISGGDFKDILKMQD